MTRTDCVRVAWRSPQNLAFPDAVHVLGSSAECTAHVVIAKTTLLDRLAAIGVVAGHLGRRVRFCVENGVVVLDAQDGMGNDAHDEAEAQPVDSSEGVVVDPLYLAEAATSAPTPDIQLGYSGAFSPIHVRPSHDASFVPPYLFHGVVMPMKAEWVR